MMELVDITDLKSVGCNGRAGSSPAASTNRRTREGLAMVPNVPQRRFRAVNAVKPVTE